MMIKEHDVKYLKSAHIRTHKPIFINWKVYRENNGTVGPALCKNLLAVPPSCISPRQEGCSCLTQF